MEFGCKVLKLETNLEKESSLESENRHQDNLLQEAWANHFKIRDR